MFSIAKWNLGILLANLATITNWAAKSGRGLSLISRFFGKSQPHRQQLIPADY